jgi:hypothetical protein
MADMMVMIQIAVQVSTLPESRAKAAIRTNDPRVTRPKAENGR